VQGFVLLALGYLAGFGPLLAYYLTHPNLYFGRGADMMTWNRVPTSWEDLGQMWSTLSPLVADNLLGVSTHSSQDIIYYAPLLFGVEAALVALGVALLIWRWRHPAAFLLLLSGLGVLFVGGTLVRGAPHLNHWTAAFPSFYAALAVPVGAWAASRWGGLPASLRWAGPTALTVGLVMLGSLNV
jgi:hypothetical protein